VGSEGKNERGGESTASPGPSETKYRKGEKKEKKWRTTSNWEDKVGRTSREEWVFWVRARKRRTSHAGVWGAKSKEVTRSAFCFLGEALGAIPKGDRDRIKKRSPQGIGRIKSLFIQNRLGGS